MLANGILSSLLTIIGTLLFILKLQKRRKKFKTQVSLRRKTNTKKVEFNFFIEM